MIAGGGVITPPFVVALFVVLCLNYFMGVIIMSKILSEASKKLAEKGMEKLNAADDKTNESKGLFKNSDKLKESKGLFKNSDKLKESKGLLAKNDLSGQKAQPGKLSRAQMTERVLGGVMGSMDTTQELNVSGYGSFGI